MALQFIPEDGSGVQDANSYLSVDELIDYADILGYDANDISPEVIEKRLIRAAIILDSRFRDRYKGSRANEGQGLEWPRSDATYADGEKIPDTTIPREVKLGIVEIFFLIESGTDMQPTIQAQGNIKSERVKADVVEEEIHYTSDVERYEDIYVKVEDVMSRITGGLSDRFKLRIVRVGGNG